MNVRRFVGKNAREAMALARGAWGEQAVVLSNRPIPGGVEILAMPGAEVPMHVNRSADGAAVPGGAPPFRPESPPMSTVSFQEFVKERHRRELADANRRPPNEPGRFAASALDEEIASFAGNVVTPGPSQLPKVSAVVQPGQTESVLDEIKSLRGMISSQLANFAWFDSVRRSPGQTQLLRLMIGNGFSPALARQLVHRLPEGRTEIEDSQWLMDILALNLHCAGLDSIGAQGGVFALVGPTGVGKTTTTAKIAASFALKHGAASVGLITVDTYRMAASDQLRAFGRILNIPVHTARDAASLVDLLDLFSGKKLVLIDTVGVGQRDRRLSELLAALPTSRVGRLLLLNANAQAEAHEEVVQAYGAKPGTRCVISKLDEAVKTGGVIDVVIRHRLVVEGFANGQRVPEDWHIAKSALLVQKALLKPQASVFVPDDGELGLLLTAPQVQPRAAAEMLHA